MSFSRIWIMGGVVALLGVAACEGQDDDPGGSSGASGASGANGTSGRPTSSGDNPSGSSSGRGFDAGSSSGSAAPAPTVSAMSPAQGDYGAEVTIVGTNLAAAGATLALGTPGGPWEIPFPSSGQEPSGVIQSWDDTRIVFRYPFPALGPVTVQTNGGAVQAGVFAPSLLPGPPLPVATPHTQREVLYAGSPAPGTLHVVFDGRSGPRVLTAGQDSLSVVGFDRGGNPILHASLLPTDAGGVEGYFASATGGALQHFQFDGTTATVTATTAAVVNGAVGFGRDGTGGYVWGAFSSAGSLEMRRAPSFGSSVRGPVAVAATLTPSVAVHADGSVSYLHGRNDGNLIDDYAYPMLSTLLPAASSFGSASRAGDGVDDYMAWTRVRGGPSGEVHSWYCGKDTEPFDPFDIEGSLDCGEVYVGPGGAVVPRPAGNSERIIAFGAEGSAIPTTQVSCVAATREVVAASLSGESTTVMWPCPGLVAGALDEGGALRLLVNARGVLYSPRPATP